MKVPVSWLREYVDFGLPLEDLARKLVFTSFQVDRIIPRGVSDVDGNLGKFLVGKVLEAGKHPNADRLQLCLVDVGEGRAEADRVRRVELRGGCNRRRRAAGRAPPGADEPLGEAKLRGELSRGMILSEREVELGADHSGIMVLADGLEPGTPLADVLPLTDDVLDIETGFNRPDLASIYGIAREVAAVTGGELSAASGSRPGWRRGGASRRPRRGLRGLPALRRAAVPRRDRGRVSALAQGEAARGRHAADLQRRRRDELRHARARVAAACVRRRSSGRRDGSSCDERSRARRCVTLDGHERELTPADLVIADAAHPVAIAGIMGGEESEVRAETTDLLLEAANFDPLTVLRTSRRLRLRTESSTRWEKGVDPYAAEQAAIYATQLFVELAGARWTGHIDVNEGLPERPRTTLVPELADRLSGMHIPVEEQVERLRSIGFEVGDDLEVTVPTWRARDVTRPVDLVEEVVRFRIEEVPATLPSRPAKPAQLTRDQRLRRQVEDVFVGAGFHEAYTWTLVPPGEGRIPLQEPFNAELAALRDSLEYWLVESARRNRNAGVERIALFELARVFLLGDGELPEERWHVAGITDGGYFRAKGAVETLHRALHVEPDFSQLDVRGLDEGWGYFEVDLDSLFERAPDVVLYEDVITYPDVKQDLAFVVDEGVSAGDLIAEARRAAGPELRELKPFDVYRGEQVGPGKKSIAFSASFQSSERTLTDEDAARLRELISAALAERFGAQLRA